MYGHEPGCPKLAWKQFGALTSFNRSRLFRASIRYGSTEAKIIPLLHDLGIGLVPIVRFGHGFLAGTMKRVEGDAWSAGGELSTKGRPTPELGLLAFGRRPVAFTHRVLLAKVFSLLRLAIVSRSLLVVDVSLCVDPD
jgi:hypothetical protein